jgi:hypothetical protein
MFIYSELFGCNKGNQAGWDACNLFEEYSNHAMAHHTQDLNTKQKKLGASTYSADYKRCLRFTEDFHKSLNVYFRSGHGASNEKQCDKLDSTSPKTWLAKSRGTKHDKDDHSGCMSVEMILSLYMVVFQSLDAFGFEADFHINNIILAKLEQQCIAQGAETLSDNLIKSPDVQIILRIFTVQSVNNILQYNEHLYNIFAMSFIKLMKDPTEMSIVAKSQFLMKILCFFSTLEPVMWDYTLKDCKFIKRLKGVVKKGF